MNPLSHIRKAPCRRGASRFALLWALCLLGGIVTAQDYHFSQFYANPTGTNPALTAAFDGIVRASVITRSQWMAVSKPFMTIGAEVDGAVYKSHRRQELVGIGLTFNGDKAGDVNYSSVQAVVSLSYIKNLGRHSRHKLGLGLYGGIINNHFDLDLSTWDNQFVNGIFLPYMPSGENFESIQRLYPDFGVGAFWGYVPNKNTLFRVAVGASHINRPFYGFGESNARLPVKYTVHFYSQIALNRELSLSPMLYASWQRSFSEYLFGCNVEYFKKKNSYTTLYTLGGGLFYRWGDALVFNGFVSWQNLRFSIAYDVNVSPFVVATHGRGGMELAISYIFKKRTITRSGKEPCPYDIM
ncbi:MAG: PorP/SprF family type IX secretion system membrane protein [Bacteroidales bacterium]|nr:PorP/SprF family type IX secretion system membrane protein [Bacteroidales bacterium]